MGIELRTRANNPIDNDQFTGTLPYRELNENDENMRKYNNCYYRTGPCGYYNCHGLTFASRRTRVYNNDDLRRIIREDNYEPIKLEELFSGDLILYVDEKGDIQHSGLIIQVNTVDALVIPMVLSKWGNGSEVYHAYKNCPYWNSTVRIEYYRIKS
jgi:hypothetical protein